jgi:hypothetical protein
MALPLNNIFLYLQSNDLESNPRNGTWNDLSGNDYDFTTLDGSMSFTVNSNLQSTLGFDTGTRVGTSSETFSDYIIGTLPWTWEMYITPTSEPTGAWYFSTVDAADSAGFGVKTSSGNGNAISFMLGGSDSPTMPYYGGHYVWVRDANSNIRQYLNGVLQSTWNIGSGVIPPSVLGYALLGRKTLDAGNYARGDYSIIRGWDVALTGAQVLEAYQDVVATMFPAKITSFDFSDPLCYNGTGTVVNNLAGYFPLDITNATFVPDGQSSRMHFNGADSYLSAVGIPAIGSVFTVNFWARYTANNATYQATFSAGRLNATGQGPLLQFNEPVYGQFTASMNFGAKANISIGGFSPLDWYFVSYVLDGSVAKLYIDGVYQGQDAQDSTSWLSGAFAMGTRVNSTGSGVQTGMYFEGDIAVLDVYNTALSAGEIATLFNNTKERFSVPVISYDFSNPACYPGTGTSVTNLSNPATFLGTLSAVTFDSPTNSFVFNATGDYIVTDEISLSNNFTYIIVFNRGTPITPFESYYQQTLFSIPYRGNWGSIPYYGIFLAYDFNTSQYNFRTNDGSTYVLNSFTATNTIGDWTVAAVTFSSGTATLYIDGISASVLTGIYSPIPLTQAEQTCIGNDASFFTPEQDQFTGKIAVFEAYNEVLTAGQIATISQDYLNRYIPVPGGPVMGGRIFGEGFNG